MTGTDRPAHITCDICIIGAGSGGLSVAAAAAQMGARVVLVEAGNMGGDCLNTGCVPSKAMIAAAQAAHGGRGCAGSGHSIGHAARRLRGCPRTLSGESSLPSHRTTASNASSRSVSGCSRPRPASPPRTRSSPATSGSRPGASSLPPVPALRCRPYRASRKLALYQRNHLRTDRKT